MKKLMVLFITCVFLSSCVQDKYVCGSKSQHKSRKSKMGKMAPTMMRK